MPEFWPAGTVWEAGPDGDCSRAGTCEGGPCGPGENPDGDCPEWTSVSTYPVSFAPGGSVMVNGRTINPGETLRFPRGAIAPHREYGYPVEVFRAPTGETPVVSPPPESGVSFYIADIVSEALPLGSTGYTYDFSVLNGGPYVYAGEFMALGYMHEVWTAGGLKTVQRRISTGAWYTYPAGSYPIEAFEACMFSFSATTVSGVAGWDGTVEFFGWIPPAPIPPGFLKWGVETGPLAGVLFGATNYDALPLEAGATEKFWEWGETTAVDCITLIANPETPFSGSVAVTLRSACENPPP